MYSKPLLEKLYQNAHILLIGLSKSDYRYLAVLVLPGPKEAAKIPIISLKVIKLKSALVDIKKILKENSCLVELDRPDQLDLDLVQDLVSNCSLLSNPFMRLAS